MIICFGHWNLVIIWSLEFGYWLLHNKNQQIILSVFMRTGIANLPLHGGKAPKWLFNRMVKLASGILKIMADEYNQKLILKRISDPYWFQGLGCVLGFDWHSSGVTTVTCGALKEAINPEVHGLAIAGGKGRASRKTIEQIEKLSEFFNLSTGKINSLQRSSRLSAKVDTAALQDNHQLYHHVMIFDEHGNWSVIQQGLNPFNQYARRYHWLSDNVQNFIEIPHDAILCDEQMDSVLDMTAGESLPSRKLSVDLINDNPNKLKGYVVKPCPKFQETLDAWLPGNSHQNQYLSMPKTINWARLREAYEVQPSNYEELISLPGIGPATVRALALIGELIYGTEPSWRDPVKYSFTVGGKDGVPYPVDRGVMDEVTEILKLGISESQVGNNEKLRALQRLRKYVPDDVNV